MERRSTGLVRVPFIRRCSLHFATSEVDHSMLVNLNVLGAYVHRDLMPHLGEQVTLRFRTPDTERELVIEGVVAWLNPRQQHPVHSLPPGFGVSFRLLSEQNRHVIEGVVEEYLARHSVSP